MPECFTKEDKSTGKPNLVQPTKGMEQTFNPKAAKVPIKISEEPNTDLSNQLFTNSCSNNLLEKSSLQLADGVDNSTKYQTK